MPVIFISKGTMSGVHLLVDYLHRQTGLRCIAREDLEEKVNKHGEIAVRVLEKLANATSDQALLLISIDKNPINRCI